MLIAVIIPDLMEVKLKIYILYCVRNMRDFYVSLHHIADH